MFSHRPAWNSLIIKPFGSLGHSPLFSSYAVKYASPQLDLEDLLGVMTDKGVQPNWSTTLSFSLNGSMFL